MHARILTLVLLLFAAGAAAQQREIIRAPAPSGGTPDWLDNATTRRFVVWQQLEKRWQALAANASAPDFVSQVAALCVEVDALPREGEPQPGLRARLREASCKEALAAQLRCHGEVEVRWQAGFVTAGGCADWSTLERVRRVAADLASAAELRVAYERTFAAVHAELPSAEQGKRALELAACPRVLALRTLFDALDGVDEAARSLANAESPAQLQQRWSGVRGSARLVHVTALHLAEARIALYELAINQRGYGVAQSDLYTLDQAREAFVCLGGYRDAVVQVRQLVKVSASLRAKLESEETPVRLFQPSEQGCCKVCSAGKACGDSCISRSKVCHKGAGCACDG